MAVQWPACGPLPKCHHFMQHVGHMRNVGRTRVRIKSTVAHIRASFGLFGCLACCNAKVYLRPKFGKQDLTAQMPLFYMVCGPEKGVRSGPELNSMWPRFGPVLLYLVYSWLTLGLPFCGPNLANRSGPPKCHHSLQYVGRSKVLDLGQN